MKVCPQCGENYQPFVDFCFVDGEVLTISEPAPAVVEPEGFDAPPPPKMLQGSQQSGGYTRSATPVPRARRPGRSLIGRPESSSGTYTPPVADPAAVPDFDAPSPGQAPPPDDALRAPPVVEEVEAFDDSFGEEEVPEPQPEPILGQQRTPTPAPPVAASPPASPTDEAEEEEEEESGVAHLLVIGLGAIVLLGVVGAIGALAVGTIFAGNQEDDTEVVRLPEPPTPVPAAPSPEPVEPISVGRVDPEPADVPEPVEPEPTEVVDPIEPEPVEPEPVVPQPPPVPVRPAPDPNDGVASIQPRPAAKMGMVKYTSNPSHAKIFLDGGKKPIGTTHFRVAAEYGEHELRLELEGYEPFVTKFNLSAPELTLSTYTLTSLTPEPVGVMPDPEPVPVQPAPSGAPQRVYIVSSSTGGEVRVNGSFQGCVADVCLTPATYELVPGEYDVEYLQPGGPVVNCRIRVETRDKPYAISLLNACL